MIILLKKILIGIPLVVLAVVGLIGGKIYLEENKIVSIVKSDDGKEAVESMLKSMDDKALTPEGKIKSYKIDFDKVEKNPMGGINIYLIINDNNSLSLGTTINKYNKDTRYEFGVLSLSPDLGKLISEE